MPKGKLKKPLYIFMISVHGLIRGHDMELGADADTGGQVTYVIELMNALARHSKIEKIDLLTRLIEDKNISPDYANPEEFLGPKARIIRFPFGPKRYLKKERLWPHLDQLVDRCLHYLCQQDRLPDIIHTHYADAGYVGREISRLLGIPQIHTGHSLGLPKRESLLAAGHKSKSIESKFSLTQRIAAEEEILARTSLIITSTRQEICDQYGLYQNYNPQKCVVIPPGTDASRFSPPGRKRIEPHILELTDRFLKHPKKPMILALCRPVKNKNLQALLAAYGQDVALQKMANLVIIAGNREDIRELDEDQKNVLSDLLFDIDRYNLWGKVAIPKQHACEDVPELYRLAYRRRGVFVNPALSESFGLTLIEAAASGLPLIATEDGGPRDILSNLHNGLLINPLDESSIADALKQVLSDRMQWRHFSKNGVAGIKHHYTWNAHVIKYMKSVTNMLHREQKSWRRQRSFCMQEKNISHPLAKKLLVCDIDNTLIGHKKSLKELMKWVRENSKYVTFGIATGRTLESTLNILKEWNVPTPQILITSVGSELCYGPDLLQDKGWSHHIHHAWQRDALVTALSEIPGLAMQTEENQRLFKLSYQINPNEMPSLKQLYSHLRENKLRANLIYSHNAFLDVLPVRASKGHALRYLAHKWGLPLKNFVVAGDSGNDAEMLRGDTSGIVVGNASEELLKQVCNLEQVYFAQGCHAQGIIEGLEHYGFKKSSHDLEILK